MGKMGRGFPAPKKDVKSKAEAVDVPLKDKAAAARKKKSA